jgi:hypothetical protein
LLTVLRQSLKLKINQKIGKGKKGKKGKKGMMKLFLMGAIIKSKIELLLKVLSFHLQLKFFFIAVAGLFINLARFWIDLKKQPQKVSERKNLLINPLAFFLLTVY